MSSCHARRRSRKSSTTKRGPGKYQAGIRYAFVPERFEAYASYGNRLGSSTSDGWWAVIGIRINTAAFLP